MAGRASGARNSAADGPAARDAGGRSRKRRLCEARAGPGSGPDRTCWQGSDVSGAGSVGRARLRGPRRWDAQERGGPGPDPACEAGPPRASRVFGCREAAGSPAKAAGRWCRNAACTPVSAVLARRQGALCPARTTADRKIAPDASFIFRIKGLGRGGADGPLARTAGTPSARRSLMSRPDNTARRRRRLRFPDGICVTRPLPPAKRILGAIIFPFFSRCLRGGATPPGGSGSPIRPAGSFRVGH